MVRSCRGPFYYLQLIVRSGKLSTAFCFSSSIICIYFSVCLVVEWPAREAAVLMLAPFAMIFVIKEWRAQWKVICFRILASITHLRRILIVYEQEGSEKTKSSLSPLHFCKSLRAVWFKFKCKMALLECVCTFCCMMVNLLAGKSTSLYLSLIHI